MAELYEGMHVQHFKTGRSGKIVTWYGRGPKAGKMWIAFDDGEVELRWRKAFVPIFTDVQCWLGSVVAQ